MGLQIPYLLLFQFFGADQLQRSYHKHWGYLDHTQHGHRALLQLTVTFVGLDLRNLVLSAVGAKSLGNVPTLGVVKLWQRRPLGMSLWLESCLMNAEQRVSAEGFAY